MTSGVEPGDVEVSNPDKVLFPDAGLTKRDLADYYARIAPVLLPHLADRPLSLRRFPDGIDGDGFYQKEVSGQVPDWLRTATVEKEDGEVTMAVVDDAAGLVVLANLAAIELHAWLSRVDAPERPDRLVFDLDPSAPDLDLLRDAARWLRDLLADAGLEPRLMTTGSRGVHVAAALDGEAGYEASRSFARAVAEELARRHPDRVTVEHRRSKRGDRLYLDVGRNAYAQTAIAPYSVRARPGAPVAAPLDWDELAGDRFAPDRVTIENVFRRLGQKPDPWVDPGRPGSIAGARERLAGILDDRSS